MIGRSAAIRTATTPGTASAASRSIRSIRAWAGSASTGRACRRPRASWSAAKRAEPVTLASPSMRGIDRPIAVVRPMSRPPRRRSRRPASAARRLRVRARRAPHRSTGRPRRRCASCRWSTDCVPMIAMGAKGWLDHPGQGDLGRRQAAGRPELGRAGAAGLVGGGAVGVEPSARQVGVVREVAVAGRRPRDQPRAGCDANQARDASSVASTTPGHGAPADRASDSELLHQAIGGQPRDAA